ncbi:MAG: SoxR reducing system RseC family protein [Eubacterium sp.]|nr:SoxR reducing system RseC family protein [Eubacterium sp.]
MQEYGTVKAIEGRRARVVIKRHAACGDCGACQVGREKMTMETLADNRLGASVGDNVLVSMEFVNVIAATSIMYGIPLLAFLLGCGLGYLAALQFALDTVLVPFFAGIAAIAAAYLGIKAADKRGLFHRKYEPVITEIVKA